MLAYFSECWRRLCLSKQQLYLHSNNRSKAAIPPMAHQHPPKTSSRLNSSNKCRLNRTTERLLDNSPSTNLVHHLRWLNSSRQCRCSNSSRNSVVRQLSIRELKLLCFSK